MKKPALKIGCVLLTGAALGACGGTAIDSSHGQGDGDGDGYGGSSGGFVGTIGTGGSTGTGGTAGIDCSFSNCGTGGFPGTGGAPGIPVGSQVLEPTLDDYEDAVDRAECAYGSAEQFIYKGAIRPVAAQGDRVFFTTVQGLMALSSDQSIPDVLSLDPNIEACVLAEEELFCASKTLLRIPLSGEPETSYPLLVRALGSTGEDIFALDAATQSVLAMKASETSFSPLSSPLALPTDPSLQLLFAENTNSLFFREEQSKLMQITQVSKDSGVAQSFSTATPLGRLYADDFHVYWVEADSTITRQELATQTTSPWIEYSPWPSALAGDDSHLYWIAQEFGPGDSAVLRTPKGGSSPASDTRILTRFLGASDTQLIPGHGCLFWVNGGNLYATAK